MAEHAPAHQPAAAKHDAVPQSVHDVLRNPGDQLPRAQQAAFGPRFETDFSTVRVHADARADQSTRELGALAYTWGNHVVLGSQAQHGLAPERRSAVLAHELAHVAQQRGEAGGQPDRVLSANDSAETHAHDATSHVLAGRRAPAAPRVAAGVALLTVAEAERKVWSEVPDVAKNLLRPYLPTAKATVDAIVPPSTELPKPVEAAVDTAASVMHDVKPTLDAALSSVLPLATPGPATPAAPKAAPKPKAPGAPAKPKSSVIGELRDFALEKVGVVKGVGLEVGNIADSLLWIPQAAHDLTEYALEHAQSVGVDPETQQRALDFFHAQTAEYDRILEVAKHYGLYDETTKTVGVSKQIAGAFDSVAGRIGGPLTNPDSLMFTRYEIGELGGAVGLQALLATVGVEEVQLVLKGLGLLGAAKSIVDEARSDPGWMKSVKFWTKVIGLGLSVFGIARTKAAGTITRIILSSEVPVLAVPMVLQLIEDATNPKLNANERDAKTQYDMEVLAKFIVVAIVAVLRRAQADADKLPTGRAPDEGSTPRTTTTAAKEPNENQAPTTTAPPVTETPTTAAPANEAPTTAAPTNQGPTTSAPPTETPVTTTPANEAPTTAAPANEAPRPAPIRPRRPRPAEPEPARPAHLDLRSKAADVTKPGYNQPKFPPVTGPLPPVKRVPEGRYIEPMKSVPLPPAKKAMSPQELNEVADIKSFPGGGQQTLPATAGIDAVVRGGTFKETVVRDPETGEVRGVLHETEGGEFLQDKELDTPFAPLPEKAVARPGQSDVQANMERKVTFHVKDAVKKYVKAVGEGHEGIIRQRQTMANGVEYSAVYRFPRGFYLLLKIHDFEKVPPALQKEISDLARDLLAAEVAKADGGRGLETVFRDVSVTVEVRPASAGTSSGPDASDATTKEP